VNVVVTGGSGFIGGQVVDELRVRGMTATVADVTRGHDVRNAGKMLELVEGHDAVIHLAGVLGTHELFDTPHLAIDVNVTGSLNVLEACRVNGAAYVGITMPQVFPSLYTATKVAATRLATAYHHTHGVPVSHVRAYNAFGPGQHHGPGHPQKIVPTFAVCGWRGDPMPVWGDGTQGVDLIYNDDLARVLVDALEFGDDRTIDGGTGQPFTVLDVCRMVGDITGSHDVEHLPMRRGEKPTDIVAGGEGWDDLGWRPRFDLDDLRFTVESYAAHPMVEAA
jgi:UDP-glucose 4-epimerase